MKSYLASPFGGKDSKHRKDAEKVAQILRETDNEVYCPWKYQVPNAWDYPNTEWGLMVFTNDVQAIDDCNIMVALSYGKYETSSGTNWEIGYAYAKGKQVIVVEMEDPQVMSLMVSNGCYSRVRGIEGLQELIEFNPFLLTAARPRTSTWQE